MEAYLTVTDVALMVRVSVQTIRRYTMKKEIPFHKINRMVRYKKSEIEEWVENRAASSAAKEQTAKEQTAKEETAKGEETEGNLFDETESGADG